MAKKRKVSFEDYRSAVAQKLNAASKYLKHGTMGERNSLRDDLGLQVSFSNLLKVAENMYEATSGRDPVAEYIANFSQGSGYADISSVQTVGAIDVSIMTLATSIVPFVCVDRAMNNPVDTIYYNNLVAVNSAGGAAAGEIVSPNFAPPDSNVNLGPATVTATLVGTSGTASSSSTVNLGTYLVPKNTVVTITNTSTTALVSTGQDFDGSGTIYFNLAYAGSATINYSTGVLTVPTLAATLTLSVSALADVESDDTGSNILKIKPEYTPTQLVTIPKTVILEENAANAMYMNRIFANSKRVAGLGDYTNLHFARVADVFTEDINRMVLKQIVGLSSNDSSPSALSLASYGVTGFAETKDSLVTRFFIDMRQRFLAKTGIPATVCVTGSKGCAELESHATKWVPAPNFYSHLNGFAGTFDGIPVFRHNYIDGITPANKANFYMACKLPDNSSGTMAYGEFLPLTQTGAVGNYQNPLQSSTGWFAQVGSQVIQNQLITFGQISYT